MYKHNIEWLTKNDLENYDGDNEDIKSRVARAKSEIFTFESEVFESIMNGIENELNQIEFLNNKKASTISEDFKLYSDKEIEKHRDNITQYGNQVFSMYSREDLLSLYEKNRQRIQARIDFSKEKLAENPNDTVSITSLRSDEAELEKINHSISILNGDALEIVNSYVYNSEIGQKLL